MNPNTHYCFAPYMQRVYLSVHEWLALQDGVESYKGRKPNLNKDDLRNVASHFDGRFAAHYFKVVHTLDQVVGQRTLLSWLQHNPQICFVDVACGAGPASAAFLDAVVRLREAGTLSQSPEILFVGVDPSVHALALYGRIMDGLEQETSGMRICASHRVVSEGIPGATATLCFQLEEARRLWRVPCLPHVLVAQVNIVRPLRSGLRDRIGIRQLLVSLGIGRALFSDRQDDDYGRDEVLGYQDWSREFRLITCISSRLPRMRTPSGQSC